VAYLRRQVAEPPAWVRVGANAELNWPRSTVGWVRLRKFCRWARGEGFLENDPTEGIRGIASAETALQALDNPCNN